MKDTIRQAFGLLDSGARPWLAAHLIAGVLASFIEAGGVGMVYVFFQVALAPGDFGGLTAVQWLHARLGAPEPNYFLALLSVVVVLVFLLRSVLLLATQWIALAMRRRTQCVMAASLFRGYLAQPVVWHVTKGSSRLLNNVAHNIGLVVQHLVVGTLEAIGAVVLIAVLLATMGWLRPVDTAIACVALGGAAALYLSLVQGRVAAWGEVLVKASEDMWRTIREPLRGIKTVKVAKLEEYFASQVDRSVKQVMDTQLLQGMVQQAPRYVLEVLLVGGVLLTMGIAFGAGQSAQEIVPTMALFAAASMRMLPQITKVIHNLQYFRFAAAALQVLCEDLREVERPTGRQLTPVGASAPQRFEILSVRGASFAYPGAKRPALHDIDLEIRHGEHLALVGLSGAGKTTLADMLLGLIEPHSGALSVDGLPVRRFPRDFFAYVPQDSFIIRDTLRRNIALGVPDAAIDESAVRRAVDGAALGSVVDRLPEGLDTPMSEDGGGLSGGEKQRLGLARALYRNAEVLVLDEPTSSLDALTEAEVSATIAALRGRRTVVLVAHRLSTIKGFDRILFMEGGRIAAIGSFSELYAINSRFKAMVDFLSVATIDLIDAGEEEARQRKAAS